MNLRAFAGLFLIGICVTVAASPAHAAEFTDLADAADDFDDLVDETYDPFDFVIEPTFRLDFGSAKITREAPCVPNDSFLVGEASQEYANTPRLEVDNTRCSEPQIIYNKEMLYKEQTTTLDIALKAGIYKDLQFTLNVPYHLNSTRGLKYANESGDIVSAANSSVDPLDEDIAANANSAFNAGDSPEQHVDNLGSFYYYRLFRLDDDYVNYDRSGFGDPSVGLQWAPFNDERDDTKATLLVGMNYVMPIAPVATVEDEDMGRGMHELQWRIASSKKFDWIEPYFGLDYHLPLRATDSPIEQIDSGNDGQVFTMPPQTGKITVGTEFIPHEDVEKGIRYSVDLRFSFAYTSEGRDYTPLFDHIGKSDCNGKTFDDVLPKFDTAGNVTNPSEVACAWILREPSNAQPNPIYDPEAAAGSDTSEFVNDGIMTVESYGTWQGRLGINLQPSRYFQFKIAGALTHQQEHFLTNARTGRDADDSLETTADDTVDLEGPDSRIEKNPVYNPTYDSNGNRFRIQEYNTWSLFVSTVLKF